MWWGPLNNVTVPTVVPLSVNFLPSWWHQRYGIEFGERWVTDADYRVATLTEMVRLLFDCFGDVGLGDRDPGPQLALFDLQNASIPAILGCEVSYPSDNYPWSYHLPEHRLASIALREDWVEQFPVRELIAQAQYLSSRYDEPVFPTWNLQGVQNVAVLLGGTDFFIAYHDTPDLAHHLLQIAATAIHASVDFMSNVGSLPDPVTHANCTAIMVSPSHFRRWLLPYEFELYEHATRLCSHYAIHHCGVADRYLPVYRQLPTVTWLELGTGSDVRLAQRTFKEAHCQLIVSATLMRDAEPKEVAQHIRELVASVPDLGRFSISIPDLDHDTPDENVRAAIETAMTHVQ